jgi:hypothetical protein
MLIQGHTDGDWTLSRYSMEWLIEKPGRTNIPA